MFEEHTKIMDHYDALYEQLRDKYKDPRELNRQDQSLFYEQQALKYVTFLLKALKIPFNIQIHDIRPIVRDLKGKEVEIDFRINVKGNHMYFGATHFNGRPKDLTKDLSHVNEPVNDLKLQSIVGGKIVDTKIIGDGGRIVSVISHRDYLNRKICVRIAKEGRHLNHDYIYVVFPIRDTGWGGGLDSIPSDFNFTSKAGYTYKEHGITGLILIGNYIEKTGKENRVHNDKLIVKTKTFSECTNTMKTILEKVNDAVIDESDLIRVAKLQVAGSIKGDVPYKLNIKLR